MNSNKYILVFLVLSLFFTTTIFAQNQQNVFVVKDESGLPVSGAVVIIGEDAELLRTNENGEFIMDETSGFNILIEANGFETKLVVISDILDSKTITLSRTAFLMGETNLVNVPFGLITKRQLTGAVTSLDIQEILKYDQQKNLNGVLSGRIPGLFGAANMRNNGGTPLIVVDGIPHSADGLNLQQIDQITVLKDLSSAMMYGSQASHGVILVTTKNGEPFRENLKFSVEQGINLPVSYPEYLAAADYMELYNEASENDGLTPKFSAQEIENTRSGINPIRYPDEDYYNGTYLNDYTSFSHVVGEASGGDETANYYVNVGWFHENSFLKLGEGDKEQNNRFNIRSNLNYNITSNIEFKFNGFILYDLFRGPRFSNGDFWDISSTYHPNYFPILIPLNAFEDEDIMGSAKLIDNKYLLGGTSEYRTNIYGELMRNGYESHNNRLLNLNAGLSFNLRNITPGLKANLNFTYNRSNVFHTKLNNEYAIYTLGYVGDSVASVSRVGQDVRRDNLSISNVNYNRLDGGYGNLDYNRIFNDSHSIKTTALVYTSIYDLGSGYNQPYKHLHFGLRGNYAYRNKYFVELTGTFALSGKLLKSNPNALSPGIGIGWIITEEKFFKDYQWFDFLKLRANWANVNSDRGAGYYQNANYYQNAGRFYFGGGSFNNFGRRIELGNPDLNWEKYANANIGFESMLFDYKLGLDFTYFYIKSYDQIVQIQNSLPSFFPGSQYQNYESFQSRGIETNLSYNVNIGELRLRIGSNLTYAIPKALVIDEIYADDLEYLERAGKESDAIFGWVAMGLFRDETDIDNHANQTFGTVKPGDIKYKDLNGDGIIDHLDRQAIGNSSPRIDYGLNFSVSYKNLELFALAYGQYGENTFYRNSYYWVDGNNKYSEVVLNRWTTATAESATYPRLSTGSSENNFRNSTFWIENNDWFRLRTVQLTYTLPKINFIGINEVLVYMRGNNILQVSKTREKRELNIGSPPQTRDFSLGLTVNF